MSTWEIDGVVPALLQHAVLTAVVLVHWARAWKGGAGRARRAAVRGIAAGAAVFLVAVVLALLPVDGIRGTTMTVAYYLGNNGVPAALVSVVLLLVTGAVDEHRARADETAAEQDATRPLRNV